MAATLNVFEPSREATLIVTVFPASSRPELAAVLAFGVALIMAAKGLVSPPSAMIARAALAGCPKFQRRWPAGWVATKMGGADAPDDIEAAPKTQVWLAASDDAAAQVTGAYFYHQRPKSVASVVKDQAVQEALLAACAQLSAVSFPR